MRALSPGAPGKLTDEHKAFLARIVEEGPIPAVHRSTRRTSVGSRGSIRFHCSSLSQNRFLRTILIPFQKRVRIVLSDPKNL